MSNKYEGVVIADIHIGSVDTTRLKQELDEYANRKTNQPYLFISPI